MSILIVTKPTNFEQHGEAVREMIRRGRAPQVHLDELKVAHDEHHACLSRLRELIAAKGESFEEICRSHLTPSDILYRVIFTVGGDGTLLSASRLVTNQSPVFGIRSSSSSVGYLCAASMDSLDADFELFWQNQFAFDEISRLKATIHYSSDSLKVSTVPVLNDFLYANTNPAATTRYLISSQDQTEVHKSSGVWISTAIGSTAAISAAGGEPMGLYDRRSQFVVRELYQAEGKNFRLKAGFFDASNDELMIENRSEFALLALDGQRETIALSYGDIITFKQASPIRIARPTRMK